MEPTAVGCETCGYEFPEIGSRDDDRKRLSTGWAYSPAADVLLLIVQFGLGAFVAITFVILLMFTPVMLFHRHPDELRLWFEVVIAFFAALVSLIVLIRVGNL
jgi:hypothetical protein